nr:DeoR/GlpR family DNA-binding transcription regulator [Ochrobactrum sp. Marseille-Q0166]
MRSKADRSNSSGFYCAYRHDKVEDKIDRENSVNELERQEAILRILATSQFASVNDIVDLLDVSPATVRRDIAKLNEQGAIRKVHGGITTADNLSSASGRSKPYIENQVINVAQKEAIASAAAEYCNDGDTIFIHGGTTCSLFSRKLATKSLKVITNSVAVADTIWNSSTCNLHVLGGDLHREPAIFYSPQLWTEEFYVSRYFLGTLGIDNEGLLENNPLLVRVIDMVVGRASEVVVLADSSKFFARPRLRALTFNRISTLITDDGISDANAKMIEDAGVELIVCSS